MPKKNRWFITDSSGNKVAGSDGTSKAEAKRNFVEKMADVRAAMKPWLWWKNQGYKVRRQ